MSKHDLPGVYAELQPLLFSIAYRMLGSASDAEDVVQEAFLRFQQTSDVDSPRAFLSAVVTRLCIDHLRSARVRREAYVGQWLPEPLLTAEDPAGIAADADSLSMAFLLVLERLSPVERAVFLLRDVFGYEFAELARILEKSPPNVRQIAVRARRHVNDERPRFEASRQKRDELASRFVDALTLGDVGALEQLLAADVVMTGDSGGVPPNWPRPIIGRDSVARLLVGLTAQIGSVPGVHLERADVNGQSGAVVRDCEGNLVNVFVFDIAEGVVQAIRSVIARNKLRHLGPLANIPALLARRDHRHA